MFFWIHTTTPYVNGPDHRRIVFGAGNKTKYMQHLGIGCLEELLPKAIKFINRTFQNITDLVKGGNFCKASNAAGISGIIISTPDVEDCFVSIEAFNIKNESDRQEVLKDLLFFQHEILMGLTMNVK